MLTCVEKCFGLSQKADKCFINAVNLPFIRDIFLFVCFFGCYLIKLNGKCSAHRLIAVLVCDFSVKLDSLVQRKKLWDHFSQCGSSSEKHKYL